MVNLCAEFHVVLYMWYCTCGTYIVSSFCSNHIMWILNDICDVYWFILLVHESWPVVFDQTPPLNNCVEMLSLSNNAHNNSLNHHLKFIWGFKSAYINNDVLKWVRSGFTPTKNVFKPSVFHQIWLLKKTQASLKKSLMLLHNQYSKWTFNNNSVFAQQ